ncbi:hypothetical protein [Agrobacterium tumefaciens]|uniref:hypothetical protein n=1 Tax=Agrobacterium tumefaciens TaxID=358 RepID=UPI003BA34BBA
MRSTFNTHKIAQECGVKLLAPKEHTGPLNRPGECFCRATVKWIGTTYGPDHLRLVLNLMTGTKQNAACLYGDLMRAIARILHDDQALMRRPSLVSDFDAMDLGDIRRRAQAMKCGVPLTERAGVLISLHLAEAPLAAAA